MALIGKLEQVLMIVCRTWKNIRIDLFGGCHVPLNTERYESLGRWVDQMQAAKKGQGHIKFMKGMEDCLNAIDFKWGVLQKGNDGFMKDLEE